MKNVLARLRTAVPRWGRPWLPWVFLGAPILLVLSHAGEALLLQTLQSRWGEVSSSRSASYAETAVAEFSAVQRSIRRSAVEVAMNTTLSGYLGGAGADRVELFRQLGRYSKEQGIGVELFDRSGSLIAWAGRSGPPQPREVGIALEGKLTSLVTRTPVTYQLFVVTPVRHGGQIVGAVLYRKTLDISYPFPNRYLDREGLLERLTKDLGVEVRFDFSEGAEPLKDGRYTSAILYGIDSARLGVVSVRHPSPTALPESISASFHVFNSVVGIVLLAVVAIGLWNASGGLALFPRVAARIALLWGVRYTLIWLEVPSSFVASGVFDPAAFASSFGGGLAKSIAELTLSSATLALSVGLAVWPVLSASPDGRKTARQTPARLALYGLLAAGAGLLLLWALRGYAAAVRGAVFDSSLEYLDPKVLFPPPEVALMMLNLIALGLALTALGTGCAVFFFRRLSHGGPKRGEATAWGILAGAFAGAALLYGPLEMTPLVSPAHRFAFLAGLLALATYRVNGMRGGRIAVGRDDFLLAVLFASALLPPVLEDHVAERDRRQVELMAQESTHPADVWFSLVVREALAAFSQPEPTRILSAGTGDEVERLAFTQWAQSAACREGYTAIFTAFDREGNRLSRFAIGGQVPQAAAVDTSLVFDNIMEVSVRQSEGSTKVYSGMTAVHGPEGALLGFAQVTVAAGPQVLFRGETPVFLRGTSRESLQSFYRTVTVSEFRGGRLMPTQAEVFPSGFTPPAELVRLLESSPEGWHWWAHGFGGKQYETLFVRPSGEEADLLAFSLERPGFGGDLVTLVKVLLHGAFLVVLVLAAFAAGDIARGERYFRTFRGRLLAALLVTAMVPLILLSLFGQYADRERMLQESSRVLAEQTAAVASYVENGKAFPSPADVPAEKIASELNADFSFFRGRDLQVTSRPELLQLGMLDSRISGGAYAALVVSGKRFYVETSSIGKYRYAVGYRPVLDSAGLVGGIVSVPALFRQDTIEEETTVRNAVLFGVYAMVFLAVLGIAAVLSNRIARPIQRLTEATRRVAGGEMDVRVNLPGVDGEVGELIESFDVMTRDLQTKRDELLRVERELAWKEMAKQVAHEIKNPLTPMRLSIQHLRRAYQDGVGDFDTLLENVSRTVLEQIDALSRIASEFSRFARMPRPRLSECNVNEVLTESIRLFSQEAGVEFDTRFSAALPPVTADREELRRAFINVIRNGIQAMDGRGRITLATDLLSTDVRVRIEDRGKGIPDELKHKLFQPNFSTKTDGMGLGLAIVRNTVDQIGGAVWIESEVGRGTTVTIILPPVKP
jgi:signal transduction histidine kinase